MTCPSRRRSALLASLSVVGLTTGVIAGDEWRLLGAPLSPYPAPLSRWEKLASFESLERCEAAIQPAREERLVYLTNVMLQGEDNPDSRRVMTLRSFARAVQCVTASDPR